MRYKINCLLDSNKVIGLCLETAFGLKKYCYIIDAVSEDGFQATKGFQKTFNGYYKLQKRSAEWYKQYYELFESQKTKPLSFDALLKKMYECDGKIEVSFVSKLIASTFLLARNNLKLAKLFLENGEKSRGEIGVFQTFLIAENPYISRLFSLQSSELHHGFCICAFAVYKAAPRKERLFFENKKSFPDKEEKTFRASNL